MSDDFSKQSTQTSSSSSSKFGLYSTLALGGIAVAFSVAAIPFLTPALRKHTLPYVPATDKQISNVFKALRTYSKQIDSIGKYIPAALSNKTSANATASQSSAIRLIDLGSGDGRIVFEAAKKGYHSTGVELNSMLYFYSIYKRLTSRDSAWLFKPVFKRADFWKINMNEYDIIIVFGVQEMMKDLARKLNTEMKENTLIVSCRYPISSYKFVYNLDDSIDSVWIYNRDSLNKYLESVKNQKQQQQKSAQDDDDDDD